jgi:autotransporter passenger strand-loop-strand repeat protein
MTTSAISAGVTSSLLLVSAGETLTVLGSALASTVASGGGLYVGSGGATSGSLVQSAGSEFVSGGVASATTVDSGGVQFVTSGTADASILSGGALQSVGAGGLASGTVAAADAYAFVLAGGTASATSVLSGGIAYASGGSEVSALVESGGYLYVVAGGTADAATLQSHATGFVSQGGVASATTIAAGGQLVAGAGGLARGTDIQAGGLAILSAAAAASGGTIAAGGTELVLGGASAVGANVASGGTLIVLAGGVASATSVAAGGTLVSASILLEAPGGLSAWSGTASGVSVGAGATLLVVTGGVASATDLAGGSDIVQGGSAVATSVGAGGSETVLSGGRSLAASIGSGGIAFVSQGGGASAASVGSGGLLLVSSAGNAAGITVGNGGSAVISQGGSAGTATIEAGGVLVLSSGASAYGSLDFADPGALLTIGGTVMPSGAISGFAVGDTIDLANLASASASFDSSTDQLSISAGGASYTLQFGAVAAEGFATSGDGGSGTLLTACYAEGTRIATPRGDAPIEELRAGDLVCTFAGPPRPVRWVGRRRVDCQRHPRRAEVQPVRIAASAFAPGRPRRDLVLSPDHAVFVDGVLIPVRYLVNGRTVAPLATATVTYLHVELDRHDVILAEGLPAESFLDTGNREAFANGGPAVRLQPDFALRIWQSEACAELVLSGPRLVAARRRLLARAEGLGHRLTDHPALSVLAAGRRLPAAADGAAWRLSLPAGTPMVALRSRRWVPAETDPAADDPRRLGIAIARLALDGQDVPLDDARLAAGWHGPEPHGRWTDGEATVATDGARRLAFSVAQHGRYWLAEDAEAGSLTA